tara:strand:- start:716 stop:1573 length:858 start_codon:yes stop_codon:yes gene_type:complete
MVNVLISWPYLEVAQQHDVFWETLDSFGPDTRLLVDSGAFTNWKANKDTKVEDYISFIKGLPVKPWRYFTLDKIGDPVTTKRNLYTMLDAGLTPVPIFTRGNTLEALDELYQYSDLVGLGVGTGTRGSLNYIRWVMENNTRPVHWLGICNPNLGLYYQPYSCDSTTWESGGRFGRISLYMGQGQFGQFTRQMAGTAPPSADVWRVLESYGIDPYELRYEVNWRGGRDNLARRLGGQSWLRYAEEVERTTGSLVFLAFINVMALQVLLDGWRYNKQYAYQPVPISR